MNAAATPALADLKIAVVHDWLETYAGAERVLEQILGMYPQAELFSLVDFLPEGKRHFLKGRTPTTTWIQRLPLARRYFRHYLPLFPRAIEALDLNGFDVVISSSHCVAKGVRTDGVHVCYCHTPVRYAWDLRDEYLRETGKDKGLKGLLIRTMLERLRRWDQRTQGRVTHYVANSRFVAERILNYYGRVAEVIYPPVAIDDFTLNTGKRGDYYFAGSRQVPYKKIHLIAQAFKDMPERKLVIVGDGPEHARIAEAAQGCPNITLLRNAPFAELRDIMQGARAMLFMAKEDFGIMPVEALACGTPVIAYGQGGVTETVTGLDHKKPTGVFFAEQSAPALAKAIDEFEQVAAKVTAQNCRARAEAFSEAIFREAFGLAVASAVVARK